MKYSDIDTKNDEDYQQLIRRVINSNNNVHVRDSRDDSLLHYASLYNQLDVVINLRNAGASFNCNSFAHSPLHVSAENGSLDTLSYWLETCFEHELLATNSEGMNVFHLAATYSHTTAIKLLLSDGRLIPLLNNRNIYGKTPIDIIAANSLNEIREDILKLMGKDIFLSRYYGYPLENIDQTNIEEILADYLEQNSSDPSKILDFGNCCGWGFINQIYVSQGEEKANEYFEMLRETIRWSQNAQTSLSTSLKNKFQSREELMDTLINALVITHSNTIASNKTQLGITQFSRVEQYELIKDPNMARTLKRQFNFSTRFYTVTQLAEMFDIFRMFPETSIDVWTFEHAMSLYITPDRKLKFYDSVLFDQIPDFDDALSLSQFIFNFGYHNSSKIDLDFNAYIFKPNQSKLINSSAFDFTIPINSPNSFNSLHYAVFQRNIDKIKNIMLASPNFILQSDFHNRTPLDIALSLYDVDVIEALMKNITNDQYENLIEKFDFEVITRGTPDFIEFLLNKRLIFLNYNHQQQTLIQCAILNSNAELVKYLLEKGACLGEDNYFQGTSLMYALGYYLASNNSDKGNDFDDFKSENIYTSTHNKILSYLLKSNTIKINQKNSDGDTALIIAIQNNVIWQIVEKLLNVEKIDPNIQDKNGETALMHAVRQKSSKKIIQLLIKAGADLHLKNIYGKTIFELTQDQDFLLFLKSFRSKKGVFKTDSISLSAS